MVFVLLGLAKNTQMEYKVASKINKKNKSKGSLATRSENESVIDSIYTACEIELVINTVYTDSGSGLVINLDNTYKHYYATLQIRYYVLLI